MIKRTIPILIIGGMLVTLCACGNKYSEDSPDDTITLLEKEIVELQERIAELEEENNNLRTYDGNTVSNNTLSDSNSNIEMSPTILKLNTAYTVGEVMDITITGAEWVDTILPSDTSNAYSYYKDKENETYFVVHGTITSYASDSFDIEWNSDSSILINEKYNFSSTMEFEDLDGRGFGESIKPLQTRNFIIYSSVSDEVYNICESIQVNFELPDNEEQLKYYYDEDHSNARYTIIFSELNL